MTLTLTYIIIGVVSFVFGFAVTIFFDRKPDGVLNIDLSDPGKELYSFEVKDLQKLSEKSSINLDVVVKH